ncbi:hypothetical protein FIBSPDRAFT_98979 [Athelia psychrophila]|uniref:Uncharacterized protein n=1 Tax=Athelia psychrophila TaxID=1759441 RepID=A0A166DRL9_9AGAM|nr:hypothetical protein FIBSPDRAFT_98979 [Fibularhizoctonia sp. CBS 109695]
MAVAEVNESFIVLHFERRRNWIWDWKPEGTAISRRPMQRPRQALTSFRLDQRLSFTGKQLEAEFFDAARAP